MLDTYQKAFVVYCPSVLNLAKELEIPCLDYLSRFRYGLEKRDIIALILEKNPSIKTYLPYMGNNNITNDRSNSISSLKEPTEKKVLESPHKLMTLNKSVFIKNSRSKLALNAGDNDEYQGLTRDVKGAIKSLIKEFDTSNCNNNEDWQEWFKNSTKKLFEQSPSYIIYSCHKNNVYEPQIINELYNSFIIWGSYTLFL